MQTILNDLSNQKQTKWCQRLSPHISYVAKMVWEWCAGTWQRGAEGYSGVPLPSKAAGTSDMALGWAPCHVHTLHTSHSSCSPGLHQAAAGLGTDCQVVDEEVQRGQTTDPAPAAGPRGPERPGSNGKHPASSPQLAKQTHEGGRCPGLSAKQGSCPASASKSRSPRTSWPWPCSHPLSWQAGERTGQGQVAGLGLPSSASWPILLLLTHALSLAL